MRLLNLKEKRIHAHAKGEGGSEDKSLHAFSCISLCVNSCVLAVSMREKGRDKWRWPHQGAISSCAKGGGSKDMGRESKGLYA